MAEAALAAYDLGEVAITPLDRKKNVTFRIDKPPEEGGERFLLRLCNPGEYTPEEVASELIWLLRLRRDEGLLVPEPVATRDGGLLTRASPDGVSAPWCCALFRWVPGQVLQGNLTPDAVGRVGTLLARLHRAAERFVPPAGFARPRWDCDRLFGDAGEAVVPPGLDDPLISKRAREILGEAAAVVRETARELGEGPEVFGMIHKDLEPDNIVISGGLISGEPCAIDFGDCGWGWFLYDVAASLLPLREKPGFAAMREAFLAGYRAVRPLPPADEERVETFTIARSLFAIRLMLRETMSIPKVREYAQVAIPHMLGEIRRFLERRGVGAGGEGGAGGMTTVQFLGRLRGLGIKVWAEGERLRFSAPQGALTPELKEELAGRKQEVLAFLAQGPGRAAGPVPMPAEVAAAGRYPLSWSQERLWRLQRLEPESAADHVARAVRLAGPVRVDLLARGLREVVRRHAVLRTTFGEERGEPFQRVMPDAAVPLPVVDLQALPGAARQDEAERLATLLAHRPFDLERGPVLRLVLLRLAAAEHVAVLALHGIAGDDWSAGLLFREMGALYEAFATERKPLLPELPVQYADFAWWQRQHLQGEALEPQLAFWRERLADAPAVAPTRGDRAGRHPSLVPPTGVEPLRALAQEEGGATLFMALLAALYALLREVTGEDDLVIGFPFAQRGRPEIDGLIGPFVNALALRTRLDGDPTFRELVGRVRQTVLAAQAHQEVPIEKLAEELGREGRTPFFRVAASLQNVPSPDLQVATFRMTLLPPIAWTAQLDLSCDMKEMPEGVRVSWRYRRPLFTAPEVARLADGFLALLAAAGRHPDRRLSELSSGLLPTAAFPADHRPDLTPEQEPEAGSLEVIAAP